MQAVPWHICTSYSLAPQDIFHMFPSHTKNKCEVSHQILESALLCLDLQADVIRLHYRSLVSSIRFRRASFCIGRVDARATRSWSSGHFLHPTKPVSTFHNMLSYQCVKGLGKIFSVQGTLMCVCRKRRFYMPSPQST